MRDGETPAGRLTGEVLQLARFSTVGLAATGVHAGVLVLLIQLLGKDPLVANAGAFACAFCVSFFGHHAWTFASRLSRRRAVWRFLVVQGTAFAVNNVLLVSLLRMHALPNLAAALVSLLVMPLATYLMSRAWAFRP